MKYIRLEKNVTNNKGSEQNDINITLFPFICIDKLYNITVK